MLYKASGSFSRAVDILNILQVQQEHSYLWILSRCYMIISALPYNVTNQTVGVLEDKMTLSTDGDDCHHVL